WLAGLPVVASRIGALAEAVDDGVDGLLFPPGNADALRSVLHRLVHEPGLAARLARARPRVRTVSENATELLQTYAEFAGGRR
ncbi:MAG: glycosyltransferase, partial [Planctomycetes bacterium]|nr:glycosyltransferase [Planctomycetota bacterium]